MKPVIILQAPLGNADVTCLPTCCSSQAYDQRLGSNDRRQARPTGNRASTHRVHSLAVAIALASSRFQCSATSLANCARQSHMPPTDPPKQHTSSNTRPAHRVTHAAHMVQRIGLPPSYAITGALDRPPQAATPSNRTRLNDQVSQLHQTILGKDRAETES